MGDYERFKFQTLHTIHVQNAAGSKLAQVSIGSEIERVETYEETDSDLPDCPDSRRLVDVHVGYFAYGSAWGSSPGEKPLPKGLDEVVASLKEHEGVWEGEDLVSFTDSRFPEVCTKWIGAQTGYGVAFVSTR